MLACADSRVPPEIIFDQGLGDLFDVRTAGQMIDDAVIASLEYAVKKLHVSLIVILGHEHCGAIEQAMHELDDLGDVSDEELEDHITDKFTGKLSDKLIVKNLSALKRAYDEVQ